MNEQVKTIYNTIEWPMQAHLVMDVETGKPIRIQIMTNAKTFLCCVTNAEEGKLLCQLTNMMHEMIQHGESVIMDKNIEITELVQIKKKYFELLKKHEEAMKQATEPIAATNADRDEARLQEILQAPSRKMAPKDDMREAER